MFLKGMYLLAKACMRIGEISTELYYIKHTLYAAVWIYYTNIALFVAPHIIVLLSLILWGVCTSKSSSDHLEHLLLVFFFIFHPIGIQDLIFSCYTFTLNPPKDKKNLTDEEKIQKENIATMSYISKNCILIEIIFQSLPQIALKFFNNLKTGQWDNIAIASISFSILSAFFSLIMALRVFDKETKKENKKFTQVEDFSNATRTVNRTIEYNFTRVNK